MAFDDRKEPRVEQPPSPGDCGQLAGAREPRLPVTPELRLQHPYWTDPSKQRAPRRLGSFRLRMEAWRRPLTRFSSIIRRCLTTGSPSGACAPWTALLHPRWGLDRRGAGADRCRPGPACRFAPRRSGPEEFRKDAPSASGSRQVGCPASRPQRRSGLAALAPWVRPTLRARGRASSHPTAGKSPFRRGSGPDPPNPGALLALAGSYCRRLRDQGHRARRDEESRGYCGLAGRGLLMEANCVGRIRASRPDGPISRRGSGGGSSRR